MATKSKSEAPAERILTTAFKCIAQRGCNNVTLREIAEEAGVVLSQLNYYYVNKEGLFSAVIKKMRQEYTQGLETKMQGCASFAERIAALAAYNEDVLKNNTALYRAFLEFFTFSMSSATFKTELVGFIADISSSIEAQIMKDGQAGKLPSQFPPGVITRLILATSFGLSIQYLLDPVESDILAGFGAIQAVLANAGSALSS